MRQGIYRAVVFVSRVLRWITWSGVAWFAIADYEYFERVRRTVVGAPQEAALAGAVLVELVAAYVVARASDRIWALVAEDLAPRLRS
jgi:hypothetical protein